MPRSFSADLPVSQALPALRTALRSGHAVLTAPPGSGKTTLAPLALLDEPWLAGKRILMLEPRRIAARGAAHRMADLLGEAVGQTVGYQVRFDRRVSAATRVEVLTEGILTRRFQRDPALEDAGLVIFDEFHERSLQADLGLALCLDVASGLRDDLRVLVMSATLETEAVAALLGGASQVTAGGLSYPVEIRYLDRDPREPTLEATQAVRRALAEQSGDLLVFLPGGAEIRRVQKLLADLPATRCVVRPLYGDLPLADQLAALGPDPPGRRRVVLATDIAETSLTIEGVSTVIDCGLAREPRFDPNSGLTRLVTRRVSRASAIQRAGRAGRLGRGTCYRLWPESQQDRLDARRTPEILSADLAPVALELALWGIESPEQLRWLDPPPDASHTQAVTLLRRLDALDENGRITATGRRMAELGLHPRLAHLLLQASARGAARTGADMAALLSERDPLPPIPGAPRPVDIELRLQALRDNTPAGFDDRALVRIRQTARQLFSRLGAGHAPASRGSAGSLLALAFPDRVARARDPQSGRYLLSNGRGAVLPRDDPLVGSPFLVVAHLDATHADGRIFLAAAIRPDEIRDVLGRHIHIEERLRLDAEAGSVTAHEVECLDAMVLNERQLPRPSSEAIRRLVLAEIRRRGLNTLAFAEDARALRDRVRCLREWQPDADWPDWSDEGLLGTLEDWLSPWLEGVTRFDSLKRLDYSAMLRATLDWAQQKNIERLAPTHLVVPSGHRRRLAYTPGEPPVLAVKLQELFGLAETPAVCDGRVPVMLHLLSPAGRPVQVTSDLGSFWRNTYPEVRRELKGRYPKHPWPDDPCTAPPTAGVAQRKRKHRD